MYELILFKCIIMIDTIVLRIHNIDKYDKTVNVFYNSKAAGSSVAYVDGSTGEIKENELILTQIYNDSGRMLPVVHRNLLSIGSGHYSVSYSFNFSRNYLEFNFSIPKYLFSTNIFQFVNIFDTSTSATWDIFNRFLIGFVRDNIPDVILEDDIEINRIDLCYNQFFNTKEDALDYLEHQKEKIMLFARSDINSYRPSTYRTSWEYITDRYKFKAYHKGSEWEKHDYKELTKPKRGNPLNLDLQKLKDIADRTIRYELTARKNYLNYLWRQIYANADTVSDYYNYGNTDYRARMLGIMKFGIRRNGGRMSDRGSAVTIIDKLFNREKIFTLSSPFDLKCDDEYLLNSYNCTFDRKMFYCLWDKFFQKMCDCQLSEMLSMPRIMDKLRENNETAKLKNTLRKGIGKVKDEPRILAYALLAQTYDLHSLRKYFAPTTYKRMVRDLKDVGLDKMSAAVTFPLPKLDYHDYKLFMGHMHNLIV